MSRRSRAVVFALTFLPAVVAVQTQDAMPARRTFAVTSVKVNKSGETRTPISESPSALTLQNLTALGLVSWAFEFNRRDIVGGPDWTQSTRFDIQARTDGAPVTRRDMRLMTRTLLEDRFGLEAGVARMERPIYSLVNARSDGRLGPKLRASSINCEPPVERPIEKATEPVAVLSSGNTCTLSGASIGGKVTGVFGAKQTMDQLAAALSRMLDRPVRNRTGLAGQFDFEVAVPPETPGEPVPGGEFFSAIQEQLGLKLQGDRGEVDVLVIRKVQPPTEN